MRSTSQDITDADKTEVSALGARRRLEALAAIGYTQTDLAELLNLDRGHFAGWRLDVPAYKRPAVAELFTRLQLTPGSSDRARVDARRRGWAPPLAWDEDTIDDAERTPVGLPAVVAKRKVPPDFVDTVLDHRALGRFDDDIAQRMGLALDTFSRRLHRAGLPERRRRRNVVGEQHRDYHGRFAR